MMRDTKAPFVYYAGSGELRQGNFWLATGYAGRGYGLNNPDAETQQGIGPIPCGHWRIGPARDHENLGPMVLPLHPVTYRGPRTAFFIHGDNPAMNRTASRGCIVLNRATRLLIRDSRVDVLLVVP